MFSAPSAASSSVSSSSLKQYNPNAPDWIAPENQEFLPQTYNAVSISFSIIYYFFIQVSSQAWIRPIRRPLRRRKRSSMSKEKPVTGRESRPGYPALKLRNLLELKLQSHMTIRLLLIQRTTLSSKKGTHQRRSIKIKQSSTLVAKAQRIPETKSE